MALRRNYPTTRLKPFTGEKHEPVPRAKSSSDGDGYIRFFQFYGVDIERNNQQLVGNCPFPDCRKDGHFFASPGTGQWDCKVCQRSGNTYSFLGQFHRACFEDFDKDYTTLCEVRAGISAEAFARYEVTRNPLTDEWMLPAYSTAENKTKVSNLYVWRQHYDADKKNYKTLVMSGPTLKQLPFGLQFLGKERSKPLWILEGHWDLLAFSDLLQNVKGKNGPLALTNECIASPGAGNFPKEYLPLLEGRDIRLLFDNDAAGKKGTEKFASLLATNNIIPSKFGVMEWQSDDPDEGFDIRDLIAYYLEP